MGTDVANDAHRADTMIIIRVIIAMVHTMLTIMTVMMLRKMIAVMLRMTRDGDDDNAARRAKTMIITPRCSAMIMKVIRLKT